MNNLAWELVRLCVACGAETFKGCTVCKACGVVDENGIQYLLTSKRKVILRSEKVDSRTTASFFCYQWSGIVGDPARYLQPHRRLTEVNEDTPPEGIEVNDYLNFRWCKGTPVPVSYYETWKANHLAVKDSERHELMKQMIMEETTSTSEPEPLSRVQLWAVVMPGVGVAVIIINILH